jgi:hypothetical protein
MVRDHRYRVKDAHPIRNSAQRCSALQFVISSEVEKPLAVSAEPVADIQIGELRFFDSAQNDR